MPLHSLPPEILNSIFGFVGTDNFRQDIGRLLVSKSWYELAQPVLFQDLLITSSFLVTLLANYKNNDIKQLLQRNVQGVRFSLDGHPENATRHPHHIAREVLHTFNDQFSNEWQWTHDVNRDIVELAALLQQCPKLKLLKMDARSEGPDGVLGLTNRSYLMSEAMISLLDISQITCLEFDIGGSDLIHEMVSEEEIHLCKNIQILLPKLRRLRCRMTTICPDILTPQHGVSQLDLEEVIICLTLHNPYNSLVPFRYPNSCNSTSRRSFVKLRDSIENKAAELVPMMKNPTMVRVISHTYPAVKHEVFDVLAKTRLIFNAAGPWEADGIEESSPDAETQN